MAEYPALPLFTDAFLADTLHLTSAQIGAYMLMLMAAWRSPDCTLQNDDTFLSRVCRMDKRTWMANKDTLLAFWHVSSDAKLFQKRLKDERNYVEDKRNKNVAAGNASALKRKKRHSTGVATEGQPKTNQPTPTPTIPSLTPLNRFNDWWEIYPHKIGKALAEKSYSKAIAKTTHEELCDGVRRYMQTKPPDCNWCNPATWLNQERWKDVPAAQNTSVKKYNVWKN